MTTWPCTLSRYPLSLALARKEGLIDHRDALITEGTTGSTVHSETPQGRECGLVSLYLPVGLLERFQNLAGLEVEVAKWGSRGGKHGLQEVGCIYATMCAQSFEVRPDGRVGDDRCACLA